MRTEKQAHLQVKCFHPNLAKNVRLWQILAKVEYIKLRTIKSAAFHFLHAVIPINKAKLTGALLQL
jgi:hypothetical protein